MGKRITTAINDILSDSPRHKSYSIDEILAAGGTTALANSLEKDPGKIGDILKKLPKDAFLTEKEAILALERLKEKE